MYEISHEKSVLAAIKTTKSETTLSGLLNRFRSNGVVFLICHSFSTQRQVFCNHHLEWIDEQF